MPGLSGLVAGNLGRNYGVSPGSAGYGFMQRRQVPGYYDLPGSGILPGGSLRASPTMGGQPRSMPGIEFPGTPDRGIQNDPTYGNTLGLDRGALVQVKPDTGGPGAPPMDTTGMNIPPNDWNVPPNNSDFYYSGSPDMNVPRALPVTNSDWVLDGTNTDPSLDNFGVGGPTGTANGRSPGMQPTARTTPWGYGPNYVDPRSANSFFGGLINWNGPGATNPRANEGGPAWSPRHNIGALAARFGLSGRASGGQGSVPGIGVRIS